MEIKQEILKELDSLFASRTIQDVNRNEYSICNLRDKDNKITISLVFMTRWHSLETDSYNVVTITGNGAVVTLPCYWISIPKELAMPYLKYIIEELYTEEFSKWIDSDGTGSSSGSSGSGTGCGCNNTPCAIQTVKQQSINI